MVLLDQALYLVLIGSGIDDYSVPTQDHTIASKIGQACTKIRQTLLTIGIGGSHAFKFSFFALCMGTLTIEQGPISFLAQQAQY